MKHRAALITLLALGLWMSVAPPAAQALPTPCEDYACCGYCFRLCFWIGPPPGEEGDPEFICTGECEPLEGQGQAQECENDDEYGCYAFWTCWVFYS